MLWKTLLSLTCEKYCKMIDTHARITSSHALRRHPELAVHFQG